MGHPQNSAPQNGLKWLSVDPGETTGWALWEGQALIGGGQTPLWEFADEVYDSLLGSGAAYQEGLFADVQQLVVEDFILYPWKCQELAYDKIRTARLIGMLELTASRASIPIFHQGAYTKEDAERAGAESLFVHPLVENRHQNDAIRHGVYFMAFHEHIKPGGRT